MPHTETTLTGRDTQNVQDSIFGMFTQNPESTVSTPGGRRATTNADIAVGQSFNLIGRLASAATLATPTTYTVDFCSKNAPFKFDIVGIRWRLISYTQTDWTDGDGGNLDITVQDGDGAASESFTDVLADQTLDDTYTAGMGVEYPTATIATSNTTIDVDESVRAQLIADPDDTVSGAAGADPAVFDVILECVRVN